jgi:hypothetical protein
MAAIRMLFSWLTERGILAMNPAREVKTQKFVPARSIPVRSTIFPHSPILSAAFRTRLSRNYFN